MTKWGTHGLWAETAPTGPATLPLAGDVAADVVVIGAGYTGLSTALHLAEAGTSVVVLEAEEIGFGGSGRNTGLLNAGLWLTPTETIERLGPVHGRRILDLLGNGPAEVIDLVRRHAIECELEIEGTLHCGVGEAGRAEILRRTKEWAAIDAPVEFLDGEATARAVGTTAFSGALWDHRAGTVQPLAYARGLARAALAAGARIHERSPVTAFAPKGDGWHVVTARGAVTADRLVLATNAFTGALFPEIRAEMVLLPYFNVATAPLDPEIGGSILPGRQGAWNTLTVPTSIRRDRAGRLLIGSVGAGRGTGAAIHGAWAKREAHRLFPNLPPLDFETGWSGVIGMTRDDLPHLKRLGDKAIAIAGCNGRGIVPGTVYGRVLAEHLLGRRAFEDLPLPPTPSSPVSFRTAKELWYETGAQLAHAVMGRL